MSPRSSNGSPRFRSRVIASSIPPTPRKDAGYCVIIVSAQPEAIVDAYDKSEQRTGFYTMIDGNLALPFETEVLGVRVTVERADLTDVDEIVSVCRRGSERQKIPILGLPIPKLPPAGAEWIEAYRRWARGA